MQRRNIMKTFLGSLYHVFDMANHTHIIWCVVILLVMLMLAVLHHFWKNNVGKIRIWRFLCLLPLLIALVHFLLYVQGEPMLISVFLLLYVIALLPLLLIPFAKRKIGYRVVSVLTGVVSAAAGFYFCATSPNVFNFTRMSYTESFHALAEKMDETYVLRDWKGKDLAALEEIYMPLVEEAEKEQDPAKFCDAVKLFCNELHDGHIYVAANYDTEAYPSQLRQREYGLSMVQLDQGDVIAVCTLEEVQKLGITDGTVITHWNGKPIEQALQEDLPDQGFPVKANADRMGAMYLAGVGGDTVDVTFLDASGEERIVTLSDLGEIRTFPEALLAYTRMPVLATDEDIEAFLAKNFSIRMLDDRCGYLVLNMEATDSDLQDILAYLKGDHTWAREMFREKLRDLKAQGMEYLVVDLRNNVGGMDEVCCALVSLLTEEDWFAQGLGIRRDGEYICVSEHFVLGDGEFADLQVAALTNCNCASAGDGASLYLSRLPNVTLMGITDPNGCNQETGGMCMLSDNLVSVSYPVGLIMDESGSPNIDTDHTRTSRNPVEVRIPFDYDAAMRMFCENEDYELAWAVDYLEALVQ